MTEYIIETCDLAYSYPDGTGALKGINLRIKKGQKVAVLGANGAGKSTLFLHFNGILRPQRGKIMFDGKALNYGRNSLLELRKNVGIVFQDPDQQLFSSSVLQDVAFGPLNLGLTRDLALAKARKAMRDTSIEDLKDKPTHFLSYGQKKRVSIAGVLSMEPQLIVFDEPTACLDPLMVDIIMDLLNHLNKQGKTLVISTHDVDLAYSWADYIIFLSDGKVVGEGKPDEIFLKSELVCGCGLRHPWVIDVYRELVNNGLINVRTPVPGTREELIKLIKNASPGGGEVGIRAVYTG